MLHVPQVSVKRATALTWAVRPGDTNHEQREAEKYCEKQNKTSSFSILEEDTGGPL